MTQVDWNSLAALPQKTSPFLTVYPGARYRIRVIGDMPYEFAQHWFDVDGKKKPYTCAGSGCVACRNGHRAVRRFLLPVLVRDRTGADKFDSFCSVLAFGRMLFESFKKFRFDPDFGDFSEMDFLIERSEHTIPTLRRMELFPCSKSPAMSEAERKLVSKFMQEVDLDKMSKPSENKDILKAIGQKGIFKKDYR